MFKPPVGFIMNGFRDTVKLSGGSVWSDVAKRRLSGMGLFAGGTGPADRTGRMVLSDACAKISDPVGI